MSSKWPARNGASLSTTRYATSNCWLAADRGIGAFSQAMEQGEPFQLVITDLTLPNDLDGLRIREELLKIDGSIKVILTSGHLKDPTMTQYRDHGFDAVLPKPIRAAHLSIVVSAVLKANEEE